MLSVNLLINQRKSQPEIKPWNSRGVGPVYMLLLCCYIFRIAKDFLYSFSFSIRTAQGMFEEIVNTYRNDTLKRKLTMLQKKRIQNVLTRSDKLSIL